MFRTAKRFAAATISFALVLVMFLSLPAWAQNLAEAARQERERRKGQVSHHVYTNEDLAKSRILVPEDQARVEAHNIERTPPAVVVAIDASQHSSPLPNDRITVALQPPIAMRGPLTVPPPPVISAVLSSFEALLTPPVELPFPLVAASTPKVPSHFSRNGNQPAVPPVLASAESAQLRAITYGADETLTKPVQASFPSPRDSAPRLTNRLSVKQPLAPSILAAQSEAVAPFVQLTFPLVVAAPVLRKPVTVEHSFVALQAAPVISSIEGPQIGAITTPDVNVPLPVFATAQPAVPNEPISAAHSPVNPPALVPAGCAGPCLELNRILSAQDARAVLLPVTETSAAQPAIVAKPDSIKSQPVPVNGRGNGVRVEIGGSLWKLAKRYLGDGKYWRQLATLNRRLPNPGLIRPGEWIQLPATPPEQARQIVVRPGDTLWTVAETTLGSPLAFSCIADANPQLQSANVIYPGETLSVPETCSADHEPAQKETPGAL